MNLFGGIFGSEPAPSETAQDAKAMTARDPQPQQAAADVLMLRGADRVEATPATTKSAEGSRDLEEAGPSLDVSEIPSGQDDTHLDAVQAEAAQNSAPCEWRGNGRPVPCVVAIDEEESPVRRPRPKKGRVKTRLLDVQDEPAGGAMGAAPRGQSIKRPVGWIVVVDGPGEGEWFALNGGLASIGRGEDQTIRLDFGDTSISRSRHAALAYDGTDRVFLLGDGGKANSVLVNGVPRSGTTPVLDGDFISIGETTLRLVALCNKDFHWQPKAEGGTNNVGYE